LAVIAIIAMLWTKPATTSAKRPGPMLWRWPKANRIAYQTAV
jgi:hypothetical protein